MSGNIGTLTCLRNAVFRGDVSVRHVCSPPISLAVSRSPPPSRARSLSLPLQWPSSHLPLALLHTHTLSLQVNRRCVWPPCKGICRSDKRCPGGWGRTPRRHTGVRTACPGAASPVWGGGFRGLVSRCQFRWGRVEQGWEEALRGVGR